MARWRHTWVLLITAAAGASAADVAVEKLFRDTRDKVLNITDKVPRYTCVQNIVRTEYRPRIPGRQPSCQQLIAARKKLGLPGDINWRDKVRLDVAVVDGKEMFSWPGAGRFETDTVDKLVSEGASGSGDFVGFLVSVFGGEAISIKYMGLRDDRAQFDYDVPLARSHYQYHTTGGDKSMAYSGSFFVDPSDAELERLVIETGEFPASEPICRVEDGLDYHQVRIRSGEFMLPEVATMDVIYRNGSESLNETRYSECHEYVGESTIRFDDVDISNAVPGQRAALLPLPPRLRLRIGLAQPIDGNSAAAGDEVSGVLLEDVKDKVRGVVAHRDDKIHGRILRIEQHMNPTPGWLLQLQFDRLEHGGAEQPLSLKPATLNGFFTFSRTGNLVLDRTFRSEWETR